MKAAYSVNLAEKRRGISNDGGSGWLGGEASIWRRNLTPANGVKKIAGGSSI